MPRAYRSGRSLDSDLRTISLEQTSFLQAREGYDSIASGQRHGYPSLPYETAAFYMSFLQASEGYDSIASGQRHGYPSLPYETAAGARSPS